MDFICGVRRAASVSGVIVQSGVPDAGPAVDQRGDLCVNTRLLSPWIAGWNLVERREFWLTSKRAARERQLAMCPTLETSLIAGSDTLQSSDV